MRAIKINPQDKSITEVDYTGEYRNIYTHIEADCFDVLRLGDKDDNTFFVDDEGWLNTKGETHGFFRVGERNYIHGRVLVGPALILAHDDNGESVACTLDMDFLKRIIQFGEPIKMGSQYVFVEHATHDVLSIAL